MLDFLYETKKLKQLYGSAWCGPDKLENGKETRIAKYSKEPESDGHDVEIYCTAMPARFYKIKVMEGNNSIGQHRNEFFIETGSGMDDFVIKTARLVRDGMIGIKCQ